MAKAACSDAFDAAYPSIEECESQCLADLSGGAKDSDYVAAKAHSGDTVQCRIYHATLAPSDAAACEAVFGGAPCNE
jgi:hypothetical protein